MAIAPFEASDITVADICLLASLSAFLVLPEPNIEEDALMISSIFAAAAGLRSGRSRQYSISPLYCDLRKLTMAKYSAATASAMPINAANIQPATRLTAFVC